MENKVRRSLRVKKISDYSDNDLSDFEKNNVSHTDEIVTKFSKLQTSSSRGRRSQRLIKTPRKYQYQSSDESESESSESEKTENKISIFPSKRGRPRKEQNISNGKLSDASGSETNKYVKKSYSGKPERARKVQNITDVFCSVAKSESDNEIKEYIEKPSEVLFEDQGVSGKTMFGFKRNKKRGGMAQKVFEAVNSPLRSINLNKSTQNSSCSSRTPSKLAAKKLIRQRMKETVTEVETDSSFEDFVDSGSEYKGSDSESSESELQSEEDNFSNNSNSDKELKFTNSTSKKKLKDTSRSVNRNNKNQNYFMKSDDYFSWQGSSKIVTSNHTLQKLKNPKLSEDQLQELLTSCKLNQSTEHEQAIHEMFKFSCNSFNKWMFILHEGFNILLFGLGSKRNILKVFHNEMLGSSPTIVVNGYFPSLTIKDVTDSILLDVFEVQSSTSNVYEAVELIEKRCDRQKNTHLYIIVHNIDGPMLRNNKSQNILSSLSNISNIHLVASIDHINTPLIWDHNKLSKFNFTWWDVTSFLPYTDETSFESSMLVQRSGALALSSLGNVYQSLTKNSKGIFMLIVKHQLNNKSVKYYQGMPFKVLYSQCREHFLVSSDLALRTQLTEFLDHKLVKSKRTADGVEQLNIPINNALLQQFLDQQQT